MSKEKQAIQSPILNKRGNEDLIIVHSRKATYADCVEAYRLLDQGKFTDGVTPVVFLDKMFDTPEFREQLKAEALQRIAAAYQSRH